MAVEDMPEESGTQEMESPADEADVAYQAGIDTASTPFRWVKVALCVLNAEITTEGLHQKTAIAIDQAKRAAAERIARVMRGDIEPTDG
jgi:hypothetical protein